MERQNAVAHTAVTLGEGFAQMTSRLVKGACIFVQGELTTREHDRTIRVPNGKKSIERVIKQIAVELKADTIRILHRAASSQPRELDQQPADYGVRL